MRPLAPPWAAPAWGSRGASTRTTPSPAAWRGGREGMAKLVLRQRERPGMPVRMVPCAREVTAVRRGLGDAVRGGQSATRPSLPHHAPVGNTLAPPL